MAEDWKRYEGQVVDGTFVLRQHLDGSVFLTDHGHQKAAIKLIATDGAAAESQLLRWNEAAKIAHPNLLQIYKTGKCQIGGTGHIFLVMEYAEENLAEVLPHRSLTVVETIDMLRPVLGALGYLHEKGFVHGNLKPANILAQGDQVKLASDSICRIGTPGTPGKRGPYDAPEGDVSPAHDIWALGITIVEVLTQKRPTWIPGQPTDPALPENLPQPFLDIARNCLRPERQLRWNVTQILTRLHQPTAASAPTTAPASTIRQQTPPKTAPVVAVPQKVIETKPASPKQQPAKVKENSYALPILGVIIVCVVIAALYYFIHGNSDSTAALPPAPQPQPTAETQATQEVQPALAETTATPQATASPSPTKSPKTTATPTLQTSGSSAVQAPASTSPTPTPTVSITTQGIAQSEIAHQDVPSVSQKARDTITGKIKVSVRITVDPSGQVTDAQLDNPGSSKYFSELALQSAKHWQFAPAEENRERLLRFTFQKYETDIAVAAASQP